MSTTTPVILCVDDDGDLLRSVVRTLRIDGYHVLAADSPVDALFMLQTQSVSVLVSDFEMPDMNGVELSVRAREVQPETVRIMLTGKRTIDTALDGINIAGVFRFLHKPFDGEVLRREVAAAVAHHRETTAVADERLTVVRRRKLIEALEQDHPGISFVPRDDGGAYLLDGEARFRCDAPALAPLLALFTG
jgi:DNA-binding NtrC family response regulator